MAELDYAFLAEYARIEPDGNLTAVGASYTHLLVPAVPSQHLLSVAGRVRTTAGEAPPTLRVSISTPDDVFTLQASSILEQGPNSVPYGPDLDRFGVQFALTTTIPLTGIGLYQIKLFLNDEHVRLLAFTVSTQAGQA